MFVASPHSPMLATLLGGWELLLILSVVLILFRARRLPDIMRGLSIAMSEFRKALDEETQDAGKSAGGIFGKPAAEAMTPDNHCAELYDPGAFQRQGERRSVRGFLRRVWHSVLKWSKVRK